MSYLKNSINEWINWWCWRRWRIYCPKYKVTHLFHQNAHLVNTKYGMMVQPSYKTFALSLFDWDEAFVPPCTFNEVWCGGVKGLWTPKIRIMGLDPGKDD